jgi:hypothetical protein
MVKFVRDQGLALTMFGIFAAALIGLAFSGWSSYNQDQAEHGGPGVELGAYLATPNFGEAVFENWESEFLQMGAYVLLTAFLFSRGSAESKDPDAGEPSDADPRLADKPKRVPWPVRRGGLVLALYEHSLTIVLFVLFFCLVRPARAGRGRRVQCRTTGARWRGRLAAGLSGHLALLVRVAPELAERVSGSRRADRALNRPAPARVTGIQAGGGTPRRNRCLSRRVRGRGPRL